MQIHASAVVSKKAKLAESVKVGPYSIIGDGVSVGRDTEIGAHCEISGNTTIGQRCRIFTGAVVGSIPQDLKFKGEESFLIIGNDNIIREYVTINPGASKHSKTIVGSGNLIMAYAHIAHDCTVGNECIIANNGTLAGHVSVKDKATIGGLVAIHQFVRIGTLSIIGGCSKVVQDIPPYSICDGHPSKVYGLNLVGLRRANVDKQIIHQLKSAFKLFFFSQNSVSGAIKQIKKEIPESKYLLHLIDFMTTSQRGVCRNSSTL